MVLVGGGVLFVGERVIRINVYSGYKVGFGVGIRVSFL